MAATQYFILTALICVVASDILYEAKNKFDLNDKGMTLDLNVDKRPRPRPRPKRQPCCFPKRFEGRMREIVGGSVNGKGYGAGVEAFFAFDFKDKKAAVKEVVRTGHKVVGKFWIVADYSKKKMSIVNEEKKTCVSIPLPKRRQKMDSDCLPKNATHMGSQILGGSLKTDTYHFGAKSKVADVAAFITVAEKRGRWPSRKRATCLPVYETATGSTTTKKGKNGFMASVEFFDIKETITNRKIFESPKKCKPATPEQMQELSPMMQFMTHKFTAMD